MPTDSVNLAYLSLGSNIEPESNLTAAVRELARFGRIVAVSDVWQSAPVGDVNQADFLNAAVLLETELSAEQLCREAIADVEHALHRVRDPQNVNAARTIDVDLSLFNSEVITIDHRRIPDPDLLTRPFVAIPLAELDSEYRHPVDDRTLREIAQSLDATGLIRRNNVSLIP